MPLGPRIVSETFKSNKVTDSEDIDTKYLAQQDGTLVTEQKKTTQHEEEHDDEIPEADDKSTGSREKIDHTVRDHNVSGFEAFFESYFLINRSHINDFINKKTNNL